MCMYGLILFFKNKNKLFYLYLFSIMIKKNANLKLQIILMYMYLPINSIKLKIFLSTIIFVMKYFMLEYCFLILKLLTIP
jgi:hypothetical protein